MDRCWPLHHGARLGRPDVPRPPERPPRFFSHGPTPCPVRNRPPGPAIVTGSPPSRRVPQPRLFNTEDTEGHEGARSRPAQPPAAAPHPSVPLRAPSWPSVSSVLKPFFGASRITEPPPLPRMEAGRFFTWCYPMYGEDLCPQARRVRVMVPGTRPGMTGEAAGDDGGSGLGRRPEQPVMTAAARDDREPPTPRPPNATPCPVRTFPQ